MACRTEVAGKGPGANAYWIDARALSLSAGGAGVAGGNAGKVEATRSKMVGVWETGEGERVPPPRRPLPPRRYPHGPQHGDRREKNRIRLSTNSTPDTAAPPIYARARTPPRRGRGRSAAGAGGVGAAGEFLGYPSTRNPDRVGEIFGVLGAWETGEGERVPPPRQPYPQWRYPHGPVPGDRWERAGYGLPAGSTPGTAAPLIYARARTPPAPGAGEERRRRRRGGGRRQKSTGIPHEGAGGIGLARSKVSGVWETGEGEQVPPLRRPLPPRRYPHGPQHGEILEKSRIRLPTRYRHARTPPPPGAGEERRRRGWGGGRRRGIRVSSCEGAGGVGESAEVHGYPS